MRSHFNILRPIPKAAPCLLLALLLFSGCALPPKNGTASKTGFYFDTVITVTLYDSSDSSLIDGCFSIAEAYEKMLSATKEGSDVFNVNQANGSPVTVKDETAALLEKGLAYSKLSGGAFDITVGRLSSLWNFSKNDGSLPDKSALQNAVSTVGYQNVSIAGNEVSLTNPDAAIDLGAIAKGYIADQMKAYLNEHGVTAGTINLGGNVLCIGPKPDGSPYRIGIQKPFDERGSTAAVVEVMDGTVVSSGVYERYITVDGKRYHHLLDPSTGYPYENGLLSVTILCEASVDGDGLSTACFSMGLYDGMELIERTEGAEAVFLTEDSKLHCSSGIGDSIQIER